MNTPTRWIIAIIIIAGIIIGAIALFGHNTLAPTSSPTATSTPSDTYGMKQYTDPTYGFSFWYPSALPVVASGMQDTTNFPGGTAVESVQIGPTGGISVIVVNSPMSTITDEPTNHASPIGQTKYFYNTSSNQWMTAFPDSASAGNARATTTADISKKTLSGLYMLASGRRFDTTIIPLSTTRFLVVTDGGGSSFTPQLARTVTQTGVSVDATAQAAALEAESAAYTNQ